MNFSAAKLARYRLAWFEDRKVILDGLVTGLMVSRLRLYKEPCVRTTLAVANRNSKVSDTEIDGATSRLNRPLGFEKLI